MASAGTLVTGATRIRLAAYSLMAMVQETGKWQPGATLERDTGAVHAWYEDLAEAIRRSSPAPRPQGQDGAGVASALGSLHEALEADDMARIRAGLGAFLASEYVKDLREFEEPLARALEDLFRARGAMSEPARSA